MGHPVQVMDAFNFCPNTSQLFEIPLKPEHPTSVPHMCLLCLILIENFRNFALKIP